jgi:hypothetical protein
LNDESFYKIGFLKGKVEEKIASFLIKLRLVTIYMIGK